MNIRNIRTYYMLDENKNVIPCSMGDLIKLDIENHNWRRVNQTTINDYWVSTVFLTMDHRYDETVGEPIIFETMIKNKKTREWLDYQERYSTWQEAEEGHKCAVQWVKDGCKDGSDN